MGYLTCKRNSMSYLASLYANGNTDYAAIHATTTSTSPTSTVLGGTPPRWFITSVILWSIASRLVEEAVDLYPTRMAGSDDEPVGHPEDGRELVGAQSERRLPAGRLCAFAEEIARLLELAQQLIDPQIDLAPEPQETLPFHVFPKKGYAYFTVFAPRLSEGCSAIGSLLREPWFVRRCFAWWPGWYLSGDSSKQGGSLRHR